MYRNKSTFFARALHEVEPSPGSNKKNYFFFPGLFMRLEPDIEPTKSRAATVSSKEMARFREIQNVVRNTKCNYTKIDFLLRLFLRILICSSSKVRQGRIEKITEKELVFKNGHIIPVATPDTLFIDCSATATGFSHPKVIFSGDTINLQMVIIPQPCYSSAIIAALELKYPEDEAKKNQVILDSIAVSVFDDIFIELTNTVSDSKIQITILILRQGALSTSDKNQLTHG